MLSLFTLSIGAPAWCAPASVAAGETRPATVDPWMDFAEHIKAAAAIIDAPGTPHDPVTVADGYQSLPRLMRLAWEYAYEYADTRRPVLFKSSENYLTNGWQTTDAIYYSAVIDGRKKYRISGKRGTAPLLEFTANEGFDGMQGYSTMVASVTEETLKVDDQGNFTLLTGPDPQPGNWLKTTPKTNFIFVRQYTHDWALSREAELHIELLEDGAPAQPVEGPRLATGHRYASGVPDIARVADGYRTAAAYMLDYLKVYQHRAVTLLQAYHNELRAFPHNDPQSSTMPNGHRFGVMMFDLAADEALVIEFKPQEAPYWGLQLGNFWGETLAYDGSAPTHLNNRTVQPEADGSIRVVISSGGTRPAGARNWLSTIGRPVGSLVYRQSRQFEKLPDFHTQLIKR
jgi:hypothetical protein